MSDNLLAGHSLLVTYALADGVSVFLIFTFLPVFVLIVLFLVLGSLAFLVG